MAGSVFGASSLFNNSSGQQQTSVFPTSNTPSLFGGSILSTNPVSTGQNLSTASTLGGQNQMQQQVQNPLAEKPLQTGDAASGLVSSSTQPAFFNSLLERGKKRPFSTAPWDGNSADLPKLQLGLDDIRRKARELGTGAPSQVRQTNPDRT
jgi:nuclear pore complex protein Nup93